MENKKIKRGRPRKKDFSTPTDEIPSILDGFMEDSVGKIHDKKIDVVIKPQMEKTLDIENIEVQTENLNNNEMVIEEEVEQFQEINIDEIVENIQQELEVNDVLEEIIETNEVPSKLIEEDLEVKSEEKPKTCNYVNYSSGICYD